MPFDINPCYALRSKSRKMLPSYQQTKLLFLNLYALVGGVVMSQGAGCTSLMRRWVQHDFLLQWLDSLHFLMLWAWLIVCSLVGYSCCLANSGLPFASGVYFGSVYCFIIGCFVLLFLIIPFEPILVFLLFEHSWCVWLFSNKIILLKKNSLNFYEINNILKKPFP